MLRPPGRVEGVGPVRWRVRRDDLVDLEQRVDGRAVDDQADPAAGRGVGPDRPAADDRDEELLAVGVGDHDGLAAGGRLASGSASSRACEQEHARSRAGRRASAGTPDGPAGGLPCVRAPSLNPPEPPRGRSRGRADPGSGSSTRDARLASRRTDPCYRQPPIRPAADDSPDGPDRAGRAGRDGRADLRGRRDGSSPIVRWRCSAARRLGDNGPIRADPGRPIRPDPRPRPDASPPALAQGVAVHRERDPRDVDRGRASTAP